MEQPQLSIADIKSVVLLIDLVAERGALKGPELATIGTMRAKFSAFAASQEQIAADHEAAPENVDALDPE